MCTSLLVVPSRLFASSFGDWNISDPPRDNWHAGEGPCERQIRTQLNELFPNWKIVYVSWSIYDDEEARVGTIAATYVEVFFFQQEDIVKRLKEAQQLFPNAKIINDLEDFSSQCLAIGRDAFDQYMRLRSTQPSANQT